MRLGFTGAARPVVLEIADPAAAEIAAHVRRLAGRWPEAAPGETTDVSVRDGVLHIAAYDAPAQPFDGTLAMANGAVGGLIGALVVQQAATMALHAAAYRAKAGMVVLLGDHGAGKSTFAAALAHSGAGLACDDRLVISQEAAGWQARTLGLTPKLRWPLPPEAPAALAVNTLADIYILDSVNVKIETTRRASDWLNDRVSELKKRTKESQEALEAYRRKIGVIDLGQRATLMTQQLAELSTKLITARSERNEAEAKFAQLRKLLSSPDGIETASAVLANQLIQRLREQEAQLLREMAELKITLRDQHPRMINKQGELANLQAEVNLLQKQLQEQSEAEVGLRQLESEVNANKQLLDTVLSHFKELDVQEQGLQTADARLISPATVPLRPAYPKKTLIIGFALVLAAVAGVALVLLLEHLDAGFRSLRQLEVASGVPSIGMVPLVTGRNVRPQDEVVERPQSVFAEAIRAVRTALLLSNVDRPPKTVLFTSSVPSEGKTSTAMALARASAKAGQRVIIIDCDVRSPAVHTALGVPNLNGVVDVLSGESKLEDVIDIDERSGCHYVTAGRMAPNPTDLLGSARMRQMLDRLREVYDLVVIDTPPVLAVSDTLVLLRLADKTCFVVRWGKTHREAAVNALRQVIDAGADLLGALLTQVDAKKHAQYHYGNSAYYYGAYRKYYGNR